MMTDSEQLSRALVARFNVLKPLMDENVDATTGQVLNYLFLADVARWVVRAVLDARSEIGVTTQMLEFLETSLARSSFEVKNLISIGFVQMLPSTGEAGAEVRDMLGPLLSAEYERVNW